MESDDLVRHRPVRHNIATQGSKDSGSIRLTRDKGCTPMPDLEEILEHAQTIAVVGCSDQPHRTSYAISKYLQNAGYRMIPVNPHHEEVHGEPCYPDVQSIPEDLRIDVVNIFRNPRYTAEMVENVLERIERTAERPAIWTQLGVSSQEAERLAREAGLPYVKNRCILVEHSRLF